MNTNIETPQLRLPIPTVIEQNATELSFMDKIARYKDIVILSPHLDDAVLSMGSLMSHLCEQRCKLTVVNIFTEGSTIESSFTKRLLQQGNAQSAANYFEARRKEDIGALNTIGTVSIKNLGLVDAVWRGKEGKAFYTTIFDTLKPDDTIITNLTKKLTAAINVTSNTLIFSPLACGRHIDHLITRQVATILFPGALYYTDFPYSNQFDIETDFIKKQNLSAVEWHGEYEKKRNAILKYQTQRASLFQPHNLQLVYERYYTTFV